MVLRLAWTATSKQDRESFHAPNRRYIRTVNIHAIAPGEQLHLDPIVYSRGGEGIVFKVHSSDWKRQHEIWEHGNSLISKLSPSQQDLESAVMQLQRAVELRDELLDKLYGFQDIPGRRSAKKYAIMADLEIIRPTLKVALRDLRNKLVHEPTVCSLISRDECELLSDVAWYYLRVTDGLARRCAETIEFNCITEVEQRSFMSVDFSTIPWSAYVRGYVSTPSSWEAQFHAASASRSRAAIYKNIPAT